jgi:hypothetical protein
MGAAMLVGALLGFVVGAMAGLGDTPDMAAPFVLPLVGALAGVALAWLPFAYGEVSRRRRAARELELAHDHIRAEAHRGWIDGVDLSVVRPRRADGASARRTPPG